MSWILLLLVIVIVIVVLAFLKAKAQGGAGDEVWPFYAKKPVRQHKLVSDSR